MEPGRKVEPFRKGHLVKLFYTNLIDASGVVITETSEVSTLPSSNVAHEFKERIWRTGTSVAAEYVTFDLGSATAATSAIILNHTLTAADTLIQVRGSTDNFAASNVLVASFTWSSGTMLITFNSASYRYWRIAFTKSAAGQSRDIGRIFIGTYYTTEDEPDYDGFRKRPEDLSRKQQSLGGQQWTEDLPYRQNFRAQFTHISNTMQTSLETYWAAVKTTVAHFLQVSTSSPFDGVFYVKLEKLPEGAPVAMDATPVWNTTLEYEEQL